MRVSIVGGGGGGGGGGVGGGCDVYLCIVKEL